MTIPNFRLLRLIRTLAHGLAVLHRAGLCHGDVTSDNVLILGGQPVLADPGLTSIAGCERLADSPGFTSPSPPARTDPRCDVFALGRVLYHAVTGLHPADSYPLIPPQRLREIPAAEFADLLDRCGDPDPAKRFANAGEVADFLRQEPPAATPPPAANPRSHRRPFVIAVLVASLVILAALFLGMRRRPPVPDHVKIEGSRLTAFAANPHRILWSIEVGDVISAEMADLDQDGIPEILCTIRHHHPAQRDGGCLLVLNADGSPRWQFDTTLDTGNYLPPGQHALACHGFLLCDWDPDKPGLEIVVVAQNSHGWFPTALHFLDSAGTRLATWWHPGHVPLKNLRFVRETPDSPPFLTISGYNNSYSATFDRLPPGKHFHRSFFALLDPRIPGDHAGPPGRGRLQGHDEMSLAYRLLDPQWAECRPVEARDIDGDGRNELLAWSLFGNREHFPDERINQFDYYRFDGTHVTTHLGDGHRADTRHLTPDELPPREIGVD